MTLMMPSKGNISVTSLYFRYLESEQIKSIIYKSDLREKLFIKFLFNYIYFVYLFYIKYVYTFTFTILSNIKYKAVM